MRVEINESMMLSFTSAMLRKPKNHSVYEGRGLYFRHAQSSEEPRSLYG
jgi:hypothetical protein